MAPRSADGSEAFADRGDGGSSPKLRGFDSNPEGEYGPRLWEALRATLAHLYTLSLPSPAEEGRFTLSARTYATPQGMLMRCKGTACIMTRGPPLIARGADQLLIYLQIEGSVDSEYGRRRARREAGDVEIIDYARPFHSAATDYANLTVVVARDSVPAALLALEPHGLVFRRGSGAARLIGGALQEFYAHADYLTVGEAEAAIESIVGLTTACARTRLAADQSVHAKSKRKAVLDYIGAHLGNPRLGPNEIARAAGLSRASLYRLLSAEGGVRTVLLKRRLDEALRLMLADTGDQCSLKEIARRCGFGGTSQFTRAFHARFGAPPHRYRALARGQNLDWYLARLAADGFERESSL